MKPNDITVNMDFNSTTPMATEVIDAVKNACGDFWANPSSVYQAGYDASKAIAQSRQQVAKMIDCLTEEIIFTSGGTEANNWVVYSSVDEFHRTKAENIVRNSRPHIITTNIEHDSVRLILENLLKDGKIDVTFVPVLKNNGSVSADQIIEAIRPLTVLVTVMLANNETGILQPISIIANSLLTVNTNRTWPKIYFHTDAAQAIGKMKINVNHLGIDYLTIVGHKFYAPKIGALYRKSMSPLHPIFFGGSQEGGLRPGTENTPMIVGLGVAARLVCDNVGHYAKHMLRLAEKMERELITRFGELITVNGQVFSLYGRLPNTVSVTFNNPKLKGHLILSKCGKIRASVGAACHSSSSSSKPSAVLIASGIDPHLASCTIRLSLGRESQSSDIDVAILELGAAVRSILNNQDDC